MGLQMYVLTHYTFPHFPQIQLRHIYKQFFLNRNIQSKSTDAAPKVATWIRTTGALQNASRQTDLWRCQPSFFFKIYGFFDDWPFFWENCWQSKVPWVMSLTWTFFYIFSAGSSTFFNQSEAQIVYLSTTPRHCWKSIIHIWQMAATCRRFANLMVLFKKKLLTPSMASICSSPFCKTKICFALPKLWGSMFPFPIGRFISQSLNLCQARLCRSCCGDLSSEAVEEVLPQLAYTCHELLALASMHGELRTNSLKRAEWITPAGPTTAHALCSYLESFHDLKKRYSRYSIVLSCSNPDVFASYLLVFWLVSTCSSATGVWRSSHIDPDPSTAISQQGDGGMDFTPLCKQQGCTFVLCPPANDRWHPWPFFKRFVDAAESLKTEFAAWRFFVALVDVPGWSDAETEWLNCCWNDGEFLTANCCTSCSMIVCLVFRNDQTQTSSLCGATDGFAQVIMLEPDCWLLQQQSFSCTQTRFWGGLGGERQNDWSVGIDLKQGCIFITLPRFVPTLLHPFAHLAARTTPSMDPSEESLNTMLEAFLCRSVHLDWWIMLRRWRRNGCQVHSAFRVQNDCCFLLGGWGATTSCWTPGRFVGCSVWSYHFYLYHAIPLEIWEWLQFLISAEHFASQASNGPRLPCQPA